MGLYIRALVVAFALVCFTPTLAGATSFLYVALDRSASNVSGVTLYEFLLTPQGLGPLRRQVTIEGIRRSDIVVSHDGRYIVWTAMFAPFNRPPNLVVFDRRSGAASVIGGLDLPSGGTLYSDPRALRLFYVNDGFNGSSITILEPTSVRIATTGTLVGTHSLGLSADGRELFQWVFNTFPTTLGGRIRSVDPLSGTTLRGELYFSLSPRALNSVTTTRDSQRLYVTESLPRGYPIINIGRLTVFNLAGAELSSRLFASVAHDVTLDEPRNRAFVALTDRLSVIDAETLTEIATSAGRPHVVFDRSQGLAVNVAASVDQAGACESLTLEIWADDLEPVARLSLDVDGQCAALAIAAPPDPPKGLWHQVTGQHVTLSWSAVMGATDYQIEAGSATGLSNLARLRTAGVTHLKVYDVPSGTYYVRVRAINDVDLSSPSTEIVVNVP